MALRHRVEVTEGAFEVRHAGGQRGLGVFSRAALPAGTVLFKEHPIVAMQHLNNRAQGVVVCDRCFRFLGPIEEQIRSLLVSADRSCASLPPSLPQLASSAALPLPVPCPGGCALRFCSEQCAADNFAEQHRLLCHGAASGAASSSVDAMMVETAASPASEALAKFESHAAKSNEIFLLAAKAMALVITAVNGGVSLETALEPFPGPPWWEAVATPDDVTDEAQFRDTLRQLLQESFQLLFPILSPHATPPCAPLFGDVLVYARMVGSFERRNCAVQVASPVEAYFLAVDAMEESDSKRQLMAVTSPVLDALDEAYATPCEGTGIFPLQATLNHSCEPNVSLLKDGPDEEDGRVVARVSRDVAPGEELCNAYCDVELHFAERQRELWEYGFVCGCARCEREKTMQSDGKRRLK
ncbi:hypothetical protein AB1Y20_003079 [Prymnesium parvum]|uniref:SET domain-containing protein n=1 Tax=Prymnesium parvum TaxID=97485 RepID=A0AB34JDN1_PRYPA